MKNCVYCAKRFPDMFTACPACGQFEADALKRQSMVLRTILCLTLPLCGYLAASAFMTPQKPIESQNPPRISFTPNAPKFAPVPAFAPESNAEFTPDDLSKPKPLSQEMIDRISEAQRSFDERNRIEREFGNLPGFRNGGGRTR